MSELEKEFVPYTEALALKELGFDEPCFGCYDEKGVFGLTVMSIKQYYTNSKEDTWNCAAPLYQQAFRWFRENYKLYPEIGLHDREDEQTWRFSISVLGYYELAYNQNVGREPYHKTYEEAELACLKKLIEIVKSKQ